MRDTLHNQRTIVARGLSGPVPFWDRLSSEGHAETTLAAALDGDARKQRISKQYQVSARPIAKPAIQSQRHGERMEPIFIDRGAPERRMPGASRQRAAGSSRGAVEQDPSFSLPCIRGVQMNHIIR